MKRLFFFALPVILLSYIGISRGASFAPSVSLADDKEARYITGIGTVLDKIIDNRSESFLAGKFKTIHNKIGILFDTNSKLKNDDIFVLEFIDRKIVQWLNTYIAKKTTSTSSNTTTSQTTTTSSSAPDSIDTDDYDAGDKTIVIDKISGPIIRFKVVAEGEAMEVEEFALIADDNDFDKVIEKVYIYDTNGDLIGEDRPTDDTALFDDVFTLEQGTNYLYVILEPFDNDETNASFNFTLEIREATGKTSEQDIDPMEIENTTDTISIVPVSVGSITLLDNYQGYYVDDTMYNQAKTDLAIISFSPEANDDDDDILLRGLEFTFLDNTEAEDMATTLRVQRIDSQSSAVPVDNVSNGQVSFDLTNFGDKAQVKPSTTVVLLITGTPTLDPGVSEGVSIDLDSDKTNNGIITYTTEEGTTIIGTKSFGNAGSTGITD